LSVCRLPRSDRLESHLARALRIADALLKYFERTGMEVRVTAAKRAATARSIAMPPI
jgi:hypothetical protein